MSDPNEPPRPDDSAGSGDASAPLPPPPPPSGESPYGGAATGGGDYGTPPPPPPAGGAPYGQPAPGAYSATDAIGYGWNKFKSSPATLLVPVLVIGIVVLVISYLLQVLLVNGMTDSDSGLGVVLFAAALSGAITGLAVQVLTAGLVKGGFKVADGREFSIGQLFDGWDKAQVVVAALIIGVLTFIGTFLCYFPALIVGYLTQFTIPFIVDKNMSATDAIRASFRLCVDNLGATILWYLLAIVCFIVGAILCLVGLLVAAPVVLVGLAYTFRRLQGETVSPAA
jgi:uncharacterized membrane protein